MKKVGFVASAMGIKKQSVTMESRNNMIDNTCSTCYNKPGKEGYMRFRELDKIIKQDGWYEVNQEGSHHQYKHPTKKGKVTVPEHKGKDINMTVVKSVLKQAGL